MVSYPLLNFSVQFQWVDCVLNFLLQTCVAATFHTLCGPYGSYSSPRGLQAFQKVRHSPKEWGLGKKVTILCFTSPDLMKISKILNHSISRGQLFVTYYRDHFFHFSVNDMEENQDKRYLSLTRRVGGQKQQLFSNNDITLLSLFLDDVTMLKERIDARFL